MSGDVKRAAEAVGEQLGGLDPVLALVLGSGLGDLADRFTETQVLPYTDIPGWPQVGVIGHSGQLVWGLLGGTPAVALKGRAHLYEGHDPRFATLPMRVLAELGVAALFVSNAAGAVNRAFSPGDLMLISDHLNFLGRSPLGSAGAAPTGRPAAYYDPELSSVVRQVAAEERVPLREGVYAALMGPSYETPAEIRMLERLGADAVGMSTVPEVLVAHAVGIRCFGVSCMTNFAAGILPEPLDHIEVLETTTRVADRFQRLVERVGGRVGGMLAPIRSR
ncbi:MAG: purine-nucleoside phosphorylase [Gemmatimonadota bacterium]